MVAVQVQSGGGTEDERKSGREGKSVCACGECCGDAGAVGVSLPTLGWLPAFSPSNMDEGTESTELYVWGSGSQGQLGSQVTSAQYVPTAVSLGLMVTAVACGAEHTLLLTEGSLVYSMGCSADGRLGLGDIGTKTVRVPTLIKDLSQLQVCSVACGGAHSVAVTSEGQAYSWGRGDCGALGRGTTDTERSPQPVKLPVHLRIRQASCGARHTALLAITSDSKGTLLTCGSGDSGQLGTGVRSALIPLPVNTDGEVKQVSCGVVHTVLTTYTGKVFAMGGNALGQLGIGNKTSVRYPTKVRSLEGVFIEKVACGSHTAALSNKGELYIWGSGPFGEKPYPCRVTISTTFRDISIGTSFGVAIDATRRVWTWGTNTSGELGLGDFKQRKAPVLIQSLPANTIQSLSCGSDFVLAVTSHIRTKDRYQYYPRPSVPSKSHPLTELHSPKAIDSPLINPHNPHRFLFTPNNEAILPSELIEQRQKAGYFEKLYAEMEPRNTESDKSVEEIADLKGKLTAAENSISVLNGKINYLEREITAKNEKSKENESQFAAIKYENSQLKRELAQKSEELSSAVGARMEIQGLYDQIMVTNQRLLKELASARGEMDKLKARMVSFPPGDVSTSSSKSPRISIETPQLGGKVTKAPPRLALDLLSRANGKKERTLRLLSHLPPEESVCEEDLNSRCGDEGMAGLLRESSQSITSATSHSNLQLLPSPPMTDRHADRPLQPRLRSKVSVLKGKLKALKDNQPALESKISAFEKRLRGSQDRR